MPMPSKKAPKRSKQSPKEFVLKGAIEERADGQFEFVIVIDGKRVASDAYPSRDQVENDIAFISRELAKVLQARHGMIFDTETEYGPLPPPRRKPGAC